MQYLYDDGSDVHFMDPDNYEQFSVPHAELEDELMFMQPNATVQVLAVDGKPSSVQLPTTVELTVVDTEPGVKGDTVSNVTKAATLETGRCRPGAALRQRRRQAQDRPGRAPLHQPRLASVVVAGLTRFLACLLVAAAVATIGGALFAVVHGGVDGDAVDRVRASGSPARSRSSAWPEPRAASPPAGSTCRSSRAGSSSQRLRC